MFHLFDKKLLGNRGPEPYAGWQEFMMQFACV